MPDYQNSKIYTIRTKLNPDLIYIGSTTQNLCDRFSKHKCPTSNCKSKEIINLGRPYAYIELYENYPCNNREELLKRHGEIVRSLNCVNRCIPGRTPKEYSKEYRDEHKERLNQNKRDKYNQQRKIVCECGGHYHEQHKNRHNKSKKHQQYLKSIEI